MSRKHKNNEKKWELEDILRTLGLTKDDYELLVLELKRCKIMNQVVKRVFDDNGNNRKREAVRQLTVHISESYPNIYSIEGKSTGDSEVRFDKPMDPEELKKRTNDSYRSVKSDMELSNRGMRSYIGEEKRIKLFEAEMDTNKEMLERMPIFRFRKRGELKRNMEYLQREQDYLCKKVERKMTENQKIKEAKNRLPMLNNQESSLRELASEIKGKLKERENGKAQNILVTTSVSEREDEDLFK